MTGFSNHCTESQTVCRNTIYEQNWLLFGIDLMDQLPQTLVIYCTASTRGRSTHLSLILLFSVFYSAIHTQTQWRALNLTIIQMVQQRLVIRNPLFAVNRYNPKCGGFCSSAVYPVINDDNPKKVLWQLLADRKILTLRPDKYFSVFATKFPTRMTSHNWTDGKDTVKDLPRPIFERGEGESVFAQSLLSFKHINATRGLPVNKVF